MKCSYCKSDMNITIKSIKRPVPSGAKDLNIYDKVTCWQCSKCELTSTDGIEKCTCGMLRVDDKEAKNFSEVQLKLKTSMDGNLDIRYGCTNCIECNICKRKLGKEDFEMHYCSYIAFSDRDVYHYAHKSCLKHCESSGLCIVCGSKLGFLDKIKKYNKCEKHR